MTTKILIVEDEFPIALDIQMRLENNGYEVIDIVNSYEACLLQIAEKNPDLILLDIQLNQDKSGIDIAFKIHENFSKPVVFVTASSDKATMGKAFETMPGGFVIKPFKDETLYSAIELALVQAEAMRKQKQQIEYLKNQESPKNTGTDTQPILVKYKDKFERISVADITYLEAADNYTLVHSLKRKYIIHSFLKDFDNILSLDKFIRVHKSYVVNLDAIQGFVGNVLYLHDKIEIPVSRTYRSELLSRIKILH